MKRAEYIRLFAITAVSFTVVDVIWLGLLAQPIYDHFIGDFLAEDPNLYSAGLFYMLFIFGLLYFALIPAVGAKQRSLAVKNGAIFGFMTYMTYELTNHAVIDGWPLGIVPIDIVWGTFLAASVSYIAYSFYSR